MSVRSIRISEDIETAIRYVAEREHAEQAQSLRKLARMGFEAYIAAQYRAGRSACGKPPVSWESHCGRPSTDLLRWAQPATRARSRCSEGWMSWTHRSREGHRAAGWERKGCSHTHLLLRRCRLPCWSNEYG